MYKFYFNDCLPRNKSRHEIIEGFEKVLPEYKMIRSKYINDVDGVVTMKMPDATILNSDGFTLKHCIEDLPNRDLKRYAFAVFTKYPVEEHFHSRDEDKLLENECRLTIGSIEYDALNVKIVQENEGFLFSLPLHDDLKRNDLPIRSGDGNVYFIHNLFGESANTVYIDRIIQELLVAKSDNFGKLLYEVGQCFYTKQFEDAFKKLSGQVQESIIACFNASKKRNGPTPFYADGKLIKDVTPSKEQDIKIYELRVHSPVAYRVYFYETGNSVYLGLLEKKPAKKEQSNQIRTSASIIRQLVTMFRPGKAPGASIG
jgi:hypothetical protein